MNSDVGRLDPRARRTVAALQQALTELVATTPLREITVAELCRAAGLHRTTFYKHFRSVGELAAATVADLVEQIAEPEPAEQSYRTWLGSVLTYVEDNRQGLVGTLGPAGDPDLVRTVCDELVHRAERSLASAEPANLRLSVPAAARMLGFATYGAIEALLAGEAATEDCLDSLPTLVGELRPA
ncbi:TetR/AcrR family transcriptional regulator [Georgenia sp. TF02-10]|uniref:TetR/AcrR family transcriptional regulator n=1 Tax=Georgenia sp. TF02-10 TaxID=2917725 RepID=UPI001FA70062|nr:TetR/AcrR family transcriptional regulator [Georgenia sp. TF02-10]UNX53990.1 TetR/AcrR family transcriptional regulator [Georgenia sp. TF02-10]